MKPTISTYLAVLDATFVVHVVRPYALSGAAEIFSAPRAPLHYWRTNHGNEIDFVLARRGQPPTAIECTWTADHFEPAGLRAFRNRYPAGENLVVAHDVDRAYTKRFGDLSVRFVGLGAIAADAAK